MKFSKKKLFPSMLVVTFVALSQAGLVAEPVEVTEAKAKAWTPISVGVFADSINHATTKEVEQKPSYRQYAPQQIIHIAENFLAWQNPDGGWTKNIDWTRAYSIDEISTLRDGKSSLDNRTTWSQIDYLARVYQQTGMTRYADAAISGIEYLLCQQRQSGGWRGADVDAITFNDEVMAGVLRTLKLILEDKTLYSFVDKARRERVQSAYNKGLECVLKCQIKVGDRLTAWCQQHDHESLEPVWARAFEPPSIVTAESVGVVRFLMSIENPPPEVMTSIQAAMAWFDHVKIAGLRIDKVKADPVHFKFHWSDFDRVEVKDSEAPPLWARYYDLKTEKPIFCTRERKVTPNYTDLSRERRTGYDWYGYFPAKLLAKEYPAWQRKWLQD